MQIGTTTIKYLIDIITGDSQKTRYMRGRDLVHFFNELGFNDTYENFQRTRGYYCKLKIESLNNDNKINLLIEKYYNPINFINREEEYKTLIEELNKYLYFDDLKLIRKGKNVTLENITEDIDINENINTDNFTLENHQIILNINIELYNHISEFLKNEDYFHAVEEAFKFVREKLRELTGTEKATDAFKDINQEKIFGKKPTNEAEKDFYDGVKYLHMGIQFLRNEKSHSLAKKMDKNEALHYIALASLGYKLISTKK